MSNKIEQIVSVIKYVKESYRGQNISEIRKEAAKYVARTLGITYNTVADKYLRQLKDEYGRDLGTDRFEGMLERWLEYKDDILKITLIKHCDDESDRRLVLSLFGDSTGHPPLPPVPILPTSPKAPSQGIPSPAKSGLELIAPGGLKNFPDDFVSPDAAPGHRFPLPNESIHVSPTSDGNYSVQSHFGYRQPVRKEVEGKFLVYAKLSGKRSVVVPKEMVEVTRAVNQYHVYLRELRTRIVNHYGSLSDDRAFAEEKARVFFRMHHLPWVF